MKTCEKCRWYRVASIVIARELNRVPVCDSPDETYAVAETARRKGDCGPSGRYWEPREEEE